MNILNATDARDKLDSLLDKAAEAHQPVLITGPRANAVLVAEEDWNAIQETLYLLSAPGMRESIRMGLETLSRNVRKSRAGERVAACIHQAGAKRRQAP